jgi:hypothetical protein
MMRKEKAQSKNYQEIALAGLSRAGFFNKGLFVEERVYDLSRFK